MKRKNPGFFIISFIFIVTGIFISAITFLFNLFVVSFYYPLFTGLSLVWMGGVILDLRTHYNIIRWKKSSCSGLICGRCSCNSLVPLG